MFVHFLRSDFEIRLEKLKRMRKNDKPNILYHTPHLTLSSEANP